MARIQLALNVSDLSGAIDFYSRLFKAEPVKVRPRYANFAIDEPPLKLVLIEGGGEPGSINHLGVEVFSTEEVTEAAGYLAGVGMATVVEEQTTCCYAVQDKVWVDGPDGAKWEIYTVLADANDAHSPCGDGLCCTSVPVAETVAASTASSCC
jgi:catechol 2,3-dioxygenase-like lactoylglutathione lyase family enzyme